MPFITTNDNIEIYFEDNGQGSVIAFVSGFMGIADIWRNQVKTFQQTNRVITHDNRGYGRSGKPETADAYSIERHAEDLKAVLDARDVSEPVVLVTHSMGGNIATAFTLKYPHLVRGIIYTSTYSSGAQIRRNGASADSLLTGVATPEKSVEFYKALGLTEDIAHEAAKWAPYSLKYNAQALEYYDCEDQYADLHKPVLIIQGAVDVVTPVDPYATELQAAIPGALLEVLEAINHFPQTEAPIQVSDSIAAFIRTLA